MAAKSLCRNIHGVLFKSSFLLSMGFSGAILSQEAQPESGNEGTIVEEVIVTGIKTSLMDNLELKRDSAAFIDAITAEDIGKFPDRNVADALQRVPGVSITRSGGEGSSVSIRGTASSLTLTLLNGNYVATGSSSREPTRSFNYTLLPANLIQRVEVHKTPQAKNEEGGLGGTVILHTRKPLEEDTNSGFFNLEGTHADITGEIEPQFSTLYSWKNESETFGVLASYVSQNRTTITESITTENWHFFDDATYDQDPRPSFTQRSILDTNGNPITGFAPFAVVQAKSEEERNRQGIQLTTQWQPLDNLSFTVNYFGANLEQNNDNNLFLLAEWDYWDQAVVPDSVRINDRGIITALQLVDSDLNDETIDLQAPAIGSRRSNSDAKSDTFDLEIEYAADTFNAALKVGNTKSTAGTSFDNLQRFNSGGGFTSSYGWDLNADTVISGDTELTDFTRNDWRSADAGKTSDEETYAQVDFSFTTEWGFITSVDTGLKYRDHKINRTLRNTVWDNEIDDDGTIWGGCCGDEWWHTDSLVAIVEAEAATGSFFQTIDTTGEAGTQRSFIALDWDNFIPYMDENFIRRVRDDDGFFFNIEEKITAAYVQANFEADNLSGNLGVRAVQTDQSSETFDSVDGERSSELVQREGSYRDYLPSINLKYDLTENLIFRASAAKVIARVGYGDLGAAESFNRPADGTFETTGTRGNPDLKPYEADQYDIGLEWYFGEGSFLGGGVFKKDIASYVVRSTWSETRTIAGIEQPVVIRFDGPVNLGDTGTEGIELVYQQLFGFGGGVLFNYTYTEASDGTYVDADGETVDFPLPGSSRNQYNLSGFYENDLFSARISYNLRDDYPTGIQNGLSQFVKERGQVDVNASYFITDSLTVNGSIVNLTKEPTVSYLETEDRLASRSYSGRIAYFGMNYKF